MYNNNSLGSFGQCPQCGSNTMIETPVADHCEDCGYYFYYGGHARKRQFNLFISN